MFGMPQCITGKTAEANFRQPIEEAKGPIPLRQGSLGRGISQEPNLPISVAADCRGIPGRDHRRHVSSLLAIHKSTATTHVPQHTQIVRSQHMSDYLESRKQPVL